MVSRKLLVVCMLVVPNITFGQFGEGVIFPISSYLNDVITIDLDQDGDQDIVVNNMGIILRFENDGLGNFNSADTLHPTMGGPPMLEIVDLDGDGDLDLVFVTTSGIFWKEGMGDGSFEASELLATKSSFGIAPMGIYGSLKCADLTGDGLPEIIVTYQNRVIWRVNEGDGFAPAVQLIHAALEPWNTPLVVGDVNGDGWNDHLIYAGSEVHAGIYHPIDSSWQSVVLNLPSASRYLRLIDMDQDGDMDIVDLSKGHWYENLMTDGEWGEYEVHFSEEDGGGLMEGADIISAQCDGGIILLGRRSNPVLPFMSIFDPATERFSAFLQVPDQPALTWVRSADLDGDGLVDLVGSVNNSVDVAWFPNVTDQFNVAVELPFDTLNITDPPQPITGGIPTGGTYTLAGDTLTEFDPLAAGLGTHEIIYTYTDPFTGCTGSDTASVVVDLSTSMNMIGSERSLSIFPNPTAGDLTIVFQAAGTNTIVIQDAVGRIVDRRRFSASPAQLDLSGYSSGAYTITLEQDDRRQQTVLVVE